MGNITGIIRKVDDLGRIAIPKEIRKSLGIAEGTSMEICITKRKGIFLRKCEPETDMAETVKKLYDDVDRMPGWSIDKIKRIKKHIKFIEETINESSN